MGHNFSTHSIDLPHKRISRLRILHIIDHIYPILGYQETFLAKAHGITNETLVITSDRYTKSIYDPNKHLLGKQIVGAGLFTEEGLNVLRLPTIVNLDFLNNPWLIGLEKAVTNFKPDVIIVHGIINITSIRLAMLKHKLIHSKLIFDDHMTFHNTRGGLYRWLYSLFRLLAMPIILKSSDHFIAVTEETKSFMRHGYGIPLNKIEVIPLGVDTDQFRRNPIAREQLRSIYGIEASDVVFIYVGKVIPTKGVHILVDAALRLMNNNLSIKVVIVGGASKPYEAFLKRKVNSSKFMKHFIFISAKPNEELCKYYSIADVGVWPLQCSITMNEAMSCGLPIIISDASGVPEIVSEETGFIYKNGDIDELVNKMALFMNPTLREQMGSNARIFAKKKDWKFIADRFLEIVGIYPK